MLWQARQGMIAPNVAALSAPGQVLTWSTAFSDTFNADSSGWNGYTMRQLLAASQITGSGSNIRITIQASSAGGFNIDTLYVGHQAGAGDAYDFDGNQVQLFASGSGSFVVATGNSLVSDGASFAYDETKAIIIAAHFIGIGTNAVRGRSAAGAGTNYFKAAVNEAATSNVTGYSTTANQNLLVNKIEVA